MGRVGEYARKTAETDISVRLELDAVGAANISTGIGFFDHMLGAMAKHGLMGLTVDCKGDLDVDAHHTVEDVGICIGEALKRALGDKAGIRRYDSCTLPMDEALVTVALDLSGRPFLAYGIDFAPGVTVGDRFDAQLGEEFFRALAVASGMTLHIAAHSGKNAHHVLEAAFKAFGRALSDAVRVDERIGGVLSTKGAL